MMWNFLVGVLLTDASIVLFDGNPGYPDLGTAVGSRRAHRDDLLRHQRRVHRRVHEGGRRARDRARDLSALRAVGSTGSPLSPEGFRWVYDQLGSDTWLFSTSGGTDVCTAFVGGVPTLPVYLGELQARALGRRRRGVGRRWPGRSIDEVGELVITEPMPSMPIFFWGDDGRRRSATARATSRCTRASGATATGSRSPTAATAIIYGRSDSTINRGGVRMGTSEIYRAVLSVPEVLDALVVDLPREGTDGWMPLFVVLRDGRDADDETGRRDPPADPRGLLAAPRARRDHADRRGPAHAVGQGARGARSSGS